MKKITIAVTGVGAALGQSIVRAANLSKQNYRIVACDCDIVSKGIFPALEFCQTPRFADPGYSVQLSHLLGHLDVDLVFLGSESEMLKAVLYQSAIESKSNVKIAISSPDALSIGMDKLSTVNLLKNAGLDYPETMDLNGSCEDVRKFAERLGFPLVVKGKRSGVPQIVKNMAQLKYQWENYENGVLQEYLGSQASSEYTIGIFSAPEHNFYDTFCMRRELKYGLTWRGNLIENKELSGLAVRAVKELGAIGSVNVQFREHKNRPVIHEFNVRCSSTTVFRAMSGWNEVDMAVDYFHFNRKPVKPTSLIKGTAVRYFKESWIPYET